MNQRIEEVLASPSDLPTPALIVDSLITRRNIDRLARYAAEHVLAIRPHTKTHKSRFIAQMQLDAGAIGLTVAKAGEAEQMMDATNDLLMAYPAVDSARCERLAKIAQTNTVRVAVDSAVAVKALAAAARSVGNVIGVLVDIDVGLGRTGVANSDESLKLAQIIDKTDGVRLDGIMCYPGHIRVPLEQQASALTLVAAKLQGAIDLWSRHGLEAKIISGGSTPTAYQSHLVKIYTEIRPGTYVFNDLNTVRASHCALDDCAARLICTVVSDAVGNQVVIDAGSKTLTSDLCIPAPESGHGYIIEYPQAKITKLSEEHGQVDVSRCERRPKVGERVTVIPNHICPCVNLQDTYWLVEADGSVRGFPVDAREKLS